MSPTADHSLPLSIYIPSEKSGDHSGYVRVIDRKGKSFPCGFSRSVRSSNMVGSKRSHIEISESWVQSSVHNDAVNFLGTKEITSPEECLHIEEAIFLHTRGLLRIESLREKPNTAISTQELINKILPECNISLTAYLAYAHLREQGYILMRYTENRLGLLMKMISLFQSKNAKQTLVSKTRKESTSGGSVALLSDGMEGNEESNHDAKINGASIDAKPRCPGEEHKANTNNNFDAKKNIKQAFKDDVASAPQPCISHKGTTLKLSYLAYNPNSHFRRTNPGLPDFGVAIMPYYSDSERGVTFDNLTSLLSLCQSDDDLVDTYYHDGELGFPLRVMTISDGGAVVAFGVTQGDVPVVSCISDSKND